MRTISLAELNQTKKSEQIKRPGTAKPKPQEVKVEVKQDQMPAPVVNIDMSKFAEDQTAALKMLVDAIKATSPQQAVEPVKSWEFTIERDSNNLIKTIRARAE